MSFRSASRAFQVSKAYTNLELNGGYDCFCSGPKNKGVDLLVQGGARIRKTLCAGNICVEGLIIGDLCGNILTQHIQEKEPTKGIDIVGNIRLAGNLMPAITDEYSIGSTTKKWKQIVVQDLLVCGNLSANIISNVTTTLSSAGVLPGTQSIVDNGMGPNLTVKGLVAGSGITLTPFGTTDIVIASTGGIGNSDVDLTCHNIKNVNALGVNTVFANCMATDITMADNVFMDTNLKIKFATGIAIGDNTTSSVSSGIAIGDGAIANNNNGVIIGQSAQGNGIDNIAIGRNVLTSQTNAVAIGVSAQTSGLNGIAIGYSAIVSNSNWVQLGQSSNSGTNAQFKFRSQTIGDEAWIGGGLTGAAIDNNGNILRGNIGGGWTGNALSNLNMNCHNINNIYGLEVHNLYGACVGTDINVRNDFFVRDVINGGRIKWEKGIQSGDINTTANLTSSIAIGKNAIANSSNQSCIAIGKNAYTTSICDRSLCIGYNAYCKPAFHPTSFNGFTVAIGPYSKTKERLAVAVGSYVSAFGAGATAVGTVEADNLAKFTKAHGLYSSAFGCGAYVRSSGDRGIAVGNRAQTTSTSGMAIGSLSYCTGTQATAIGGASVYLRNTYAKGNSSVALGCYARTSTGTTNSIAIGYKSLAYAGVTNSLCIGYRSQLRTGYGASSNDVVIGSLASVNGATKSISMGYNTQVNIGAYDVVIGPSASVSNGNFNVVLGDNAKAVFSSNCIAVGHNSGIGFNAQGGVAIGKGAYVSGGYTNAIAIGTSVIANKVGGFFVLHRADASLSLPAAWIGNELVDATSSGRFKENIRDLESVSDKIDLIRPVRFNAKPEFGDAKQEQIGLIAEELFEVYPEFVVLEEDKKTPKGIAFDRMIAVAIKEIQSLRKEVATLKDKINIINTNK